MNFNVWFKNISIPLTNRRGSRSLNASRSQFDTLSCFFGWHFLTIIFVSLQYGDFWGFFDKLSPSVLWLKTLSMPTPEVYSKLCPLLFTAVNTWLIAFWSGGCWVVSFSKSPKIWLVRTPFYSFFWDKLFKAFRLSERSVWRSRKGPRGAEWGLPSVRDL